MDIFIRDSKLVASLEDPDLDIFLLDELKLLRSFYQDYTCFNKKDSFKLANIFNKYEFRQFDDFVYYTVKKFNLKSLEDMNFQTLGDYVKEMFENNEEYEFISLCREGFFMTLKTLKYITQDDLQEGFPSACSNGHIEIAMWILSLTEINDETKKIAFLSSAEHIEIETWLLSFCEFSQDVKRDTFSIACSMDGLETAKLLTNFGDYNNAFLVSCSNWIFNKGICIKWLLESGQITEENKTKGFNIILNRCINHFSSGRKFLADLMYNKSIITKETELIAFEIACEYGRINIAKWIYQNRNDIDLNDYFILACKNNRKYVIEWIFDTISLNFSDKVLIFLEVCKYNKFKEVKYLFSLFELNEEILMRGFDIALIAKNHIVVKKICEIVEISPEQRMESFKISYENRCLELIDFFYSSIELTEDDKINLFIKACVKENFGIAVFFYKKSGISMEDVKSWKRNKITKKTKTWIFENII